MWNRFSLSKASQSRRTNKAQSLVHRAALRRRQFESLESRQMLATVFGITTDGNLVRFDSETPGTIAASVPITGLQSGESLLGIDFRPVTGALFGLGSTSRLYTIDLTTGAATQVDTTAPLGDVFSTLLSGTSFGFDFNPVPDRIRVVSNTEQNLRLNPGTGGIAGLDTDLTPAGSVVGAAYTNNVAGATVTTLFGIDSASDSLVMQGGVDGVPSPNGGVITPVGPLGVNTNNTVGFDISAADGTAFASLTVGGVAQLYTINLATGAATLKGNIGGTAVTGIALAPPGRVRFDVTPIVVSETAGIATLTVVRTGGSEGQITVDVTVAAGGTAGSEDFSLPPTTLTFGNGVTSQQFNVNIVDDTDVEDDLTVELTLGNATGGASVTSPATAIVTITDNDPVLSANGRFVSQLYVDLLFRDADPGGLAFFTAQLDAGVGRAQVALAIQGSVEYRGLVVDDAYAQLLERLPDAGGRNFFVGLLGSGGTIEQVRSIIIGSDEYFNLNGGTNDLFLDSLFFDALGRTIEPAGRQFFTQLLAANTSRTAVAAIVHGSTEYRNILVDRLFQDLLGRSPEVGALAFFSGALAAGARDEDVFAAIVASPEFAALL